MPASTRIKGKNVIFKLATIDYAADITSIVLENEEADSDVVTFADALAGGAVDWKFTITAVQSTDTASLWSYLWNSSGAAAVAYVFAPSGNTAASVTKPHYTGTVTLGPKPSIGGDADTTFTFEVEIKCDQEPVKVTV